MAVNALTTAYIAIAAATSGGTAPGGTTAPTGCSLTSPTDIAGWVTQVEVGSDVETLDVTTFGSGGFEAFVAGLKAGAVSLAILQDLAASAPNALLGLNGSVMAVGGQAFIEVRASSGARSATNPGFIAKVINTGWRPFNATVGQLSTVAWSPKVTGGYAELVA